MTQSKTNLAYITARTPYGQGETFILQEMLEITNQSIDLLIIPRNPSKKVFHEEAKKLLKNTLCVPLINLKIAFTFIYTLLTKKILWKILKIFIKNSRNYKILIKNLVIVPKGNFVAKKIKNKNIHHIHAHWGSTTSTMAMIISKLTSIPWSFTLHRWDIKENNLLKEKAISAEFIRCISEHGRRETLKIIGQKYTKKINVIHMGAKIPNISKLEPKFSNPTKNQKFKIITPAHFKKVKGHKYLIEAINLLIKKIKFTNIKCIFYGSGPLKTKLKKEIKSKNLSQYITIHKTIPHQKLMSIYKNKNVDLVILPSIKTKNNAHEGIPVSLMEAMSYGVPVISTNTGGISELINKNNGILVPGKNSEELCKAIKKIIRSPKKAHILGKNARNIIKKEFNQSKQAHKLVELYEKFSKK